MDGGVGYREMRDAPMKRSFLGISDENNGAVGLDPLREVILQGGFLDLHGPCIFLEFHLKTSWPQARPISQRGKAFA